MVRVGLRGPVEGALLAGALDAARGGLVDVDVRDAALGVLVHVRRHRRPRDRLARQIPNALQREDGIRLIGELLVLKHEAVRIAVVRNGR